MLNIMIAGMLALTSPEKFEFRGETTATKVDMTTKMGCSTESGITYCGQTTDLAGVRNVIYTASYYGGGLNGLLGQFEGDYFPIMLRAFTQKYGEPVMSQTEWRNRMGTVLPNTVATWTFEDGVLTLSQIGSRATNGSFEFVTTRNQPPAAPPKVDF